MWEKVQGGYVTTDTAIKGMESNTHLEDYFSIDLWALLNDLEANDDAAAERLKYISIAEKAYQKYQEQLEKIAPEKTDKRKEEMQRGESNGIKQHSAIINNLLLVALLLASHIRVARDDNEHWKGDRNRAKEQK